MGVSPPAPKKTENISKSTVGRCLQFCRSGFLLRQGKARREYCCIVKGFNAAWAKICPSNRVKCGACAKMQNRTASRAGLKIGHARFCTDFCADISGGCAVLTKFLTQLNGRGGFHRRVFECVACRLKQKCMFCRPKSQQNASRFFSCSVILHSAHTKTCKKQGVCALYRAKTNNEALHYANCKMPAKAILQVFKMRLQNKKNCATCTKCETRFCRKQLIFSAE